MYCLVIRVRHRTTRTLVSHKWFWGDHKYRLQGNWPSVNRFWHIRQPCWQCGIEVASEEDQFEPLCLSFMATVPKGKLTPMEMVSKEKCQVIRRWVRLQIEHDTHWSMTERRSFDEMNFKEDHLIFSLHWICANDLKNPQCTLMMFFFVPPKKGKKVLIWSYIQFFRH